eukprot:CAMPEP_0184449246 /NCGR_PEP_ID=MMETSP0740-20130409/4942_1 /TAXON_ID=385413 /ORGANISM="Thalassiosira miniscula, Strain CCMP1093" /LENGTH=79 /DNA_ID=CAMNT_0026819305 /DNA_START=8 /DNA_END=247 /DNA_ORIENTATION=-
MQGLRRLRAEAKIVIPSLDFATLPNRQATESRLVDMEECAMPGSTCSMDGNPRQPCCGNGTSCVYVSDLESSFCVAARG